jgi:radical SAM superfamily enzyme
MPAGLTRQRRYYAFSHFLRERFGAKVYRVTIDAGFTCPNVDGTVAVGGCVYCDNRSFSPNRRLPRTTVRGQVSRGIEILQKRYQADKFLAYFQAATNTYAPAAKLKKLYDEALEHPQIVGLAVGTRPDCVPEEILDLIENYARDRYVCLELGLQTIHDRSLDWMNRGHHFDAFVDAVRRCQRLRFAPARTEIHRFALAQLSKPPDMGSMLSRPEEAHGQLSVGLGPRKPGTPALSVSGLDLCAHVILGLPGESREDMLATADALAALPVQAIKIHNLHVVKDTPLEKMYERGEARMFERDEYVQIVCDFLERLRPDMVIHRLSGDAPPDYLVAPLWCLDKPALLRAIHDELERRDSWQGKKCAVSSPPLRGGECGKA